MGLIWEKLIVETEKVYLEYPYLCTRYGGVYFTWYVPCHFVTWVIDELILAIYYYTILLMAWLSDGVHGCFSTSSFQTVITID